MVGNANQSTNPSGALEYMKVYDRATLEKLVPNLPTQFTMWADVGGRALVWMGDVGELHPADAMADAQAEL